MSPTLEISIPTTAIAPSPKPHTVYNITIRLPLRTYTLPKRYSDFLTLHSTLTQSTGLEPAASLPPKSYFTKSITSPELTESRRTALETYLRTLNDQSTDSRWRNSPVLRAFLQLPSSYASSSAKASALQSTITGTGPITDPQTWLDVHRTLKTHLHDARLNLTNRDQATTPQKQHEAGAAAKSSLVKAAQVFSSLEEGLVQIQKGSGEKLGDGELRRRKDLLAAARRDKESQDRLLEAMVQKTQLDNTVAAATQQEKETLFASGVGSGGNASGSGPTRSRPTRGRVLGKETNETRELDNQGVLQLQKQKMEEQDMDVDELRKIVARQKELSVKINEELEVQNEMLTIVDEDVDRVQGKIDIAKKRIEKIS